MQVVMYGTHGSFQLPIALPFNNSLLGQKFPGYLENLLMPVGVDFNGATNAASMLQLT